MCARTARRRPPRSRRRSLRAASTWRWTSPALAVRDAALSEASPLVHSVREGASQYHGVVFVRADGPIQSLAQLEGTTVAWVERSSAGGYLFPRLALAREGYAPERPLLARADAVLPRRGRAGGAQRARGRRRDLRGLRGQRSLAPARRRRLRAAGEGSDEMRVLAVSPPIPRTSSSPRAPCSTPSRWTS
ncbi:MAG: phosphate/phosphite/phosphonate ABC transporter substrate-binding protein [Sandaracinaceae bacterium]|nr:phosphate/phosphite/phosphonate ABC transporter substrate-binding protein [Sandaracinaceae bacterium]